jgi:hypothetical protein
MSLFIRSGALAAAGLVIGTLACVPPASAQITRSGDKYLFRVKFAPGMHFDYEMVSATPQPVRPTDPKKISGPFSMSVLDVKGGIATVRVDAGPFLLDGKPIPGAKKNSMQVKMDTRGKMVQGEPGMQQLGGIQLPEKPLKIGESFETQNTTQMGPNKLVVKSKCTFAGIKNISGHQAAELKVVVASTGLTPTKGNGSQFLDMADGQLLSAKINQEAAAAVNGRQFRIKNTMTVTRRGIK